MENFTRSNVRAMEAEMIAVLNRFGFKNVNFRGAGARFGSNECTFKITGTVNGAKTSKQSDLARFAEMHQVNPDVKGPKGETLIEYHSRKPTYPYIYESVSGKRYKCSPDTARRMFPL